MSTITPHYRSVQQLLQSQSFAIDAMSLVADAYQNKPQFKAFKDKCNLPFQSYDHFGKTEQKERRDLMQTLVHLAWSPDRLKEVLP